MKSVPAIAASGKSRALPTPPQSDDSAARTDARQDDLHDVNWQSDLFASRPRLPLGHDAVSARAAFQDALSGRALLLDLRDEANRQAQGRLPAHLALVVRPGVDLAALSTHPVLHLLVDPDSIVEPAQFAAYDRNRPVLLVVDGGFAAWRAAGLPVVD